MAPRLSVLPGAAAARRIGQQVAGAALLGLLHHARDARRIHQSIAVQSALPGAPEQQRHRRPDPGAVCQHRYQHAVRTRQCVRGADRGPAT